MRDEDSQTTHWIQAFEQEREQRLRAEAALAASEERYRAADKTPSGLRKAGTANDEFVGLVSHELRTPITVILGNAAVLLKAITFENDAHYGALQDIRSEAERLNRLVANMLVLAKVDGTRQPDLEPMLIGPVVERMTAEHQKRYRSRPLNVQLLDAGTPCVANAGYVEQILANLLSNAEKFSAAETPIDLCLSRDADRLSFSVSDRGTDLDLNKVDEVFECIMHPEPSSQISAGVGIALAACKRLVEAQGGQIWAKSRHGGGTEFGFSLRVAESAD